MANKKGNGNFIAVLTMIFLFGMISFVTNLAAPIGNIWKMQPQIAGSNALGMMGNMMNFLAYAFMGIPAGNMLSKYGYKKTALIAIAVGFIGVFIQFLSGVIAGFPANFIVYLLGAFISGFSVCIGTLTAQSVIADVNPVLFIAMAVFALAFVILLFVPISDPEQVADSAHAESPMKYRHFIYGVIAIFLYVGVEVGIPGTLNFYLSDPQSGAGMDPSIAVRIAGFVAGTYWFLMLIGRLVSSLISGKVSSKAQLTCVSCVAIILMLCAMFISPSHKASMPAFTGSGFEMVNVPLSALLLVLCGLCTSVMWGTILASGIFMAMVVGGGIVPLFQNWIADKVGYMPSYWVLVCSLFFIFFFAVAGSKVKKAA